MAISSLIIDAGNGQFFVNIGLYAWDIGSTVNEALLQLESTDGATLCAVNGRWHIVCTRDRIERYRLIAEMMMKAIGPQKAENCG